MNVINGEFESLRGLFERYVTEFVWFH